MEQPTEQPVQIGVQPALGGQAVGIAGAGGQNQISALDDRIPLQRNGQPPLELWQQILDSVEQHSTAGAVAHQHIRADRAFPLLRGEGGALDEHQRESGLGAAVGEVVGQLHLFCAGSPQISTTPLRLCR